jgi:hypothetical protein
MHFDADSVVDESVFALEDMATYLAERITHIRLVASNMISNGCAGGLRAVSIVLRGAHNPPVWKASLPTVNAFSKLYRLNAFEIHLFKIQDTSHCVKCMISTVCFALLRKGPWPSIRGDAPCLVIR